MVMSAKVCTNASCNLSAIAEFFCHGTAELHRSHQYCDHCVTMWVCGYVCAVKSQLQAARMYKPHPQIWSQYTGKILVPIDKLHRYFAEVVRSVSATSRIVIYQILLL